MKKKKAKKAKNRNQNRNKTLNNTQNKTPNKPKYTVLKILSPMLFLLFEGIFFLSYSLYALYSGEIFLPADIDYTSSFFYQSESPFWFTITFLIHFGTGLIFITMGYHGVIGVIKNRKTISDEE